MATNTEYGDWVKLQLPDRRKLVAYKLSREDSTSIVAAPRKFRLYGSNDDSTWTEIVGSAVTRGATDPINSKTQTPNADSTSGSRFDLATVSPAYQYFALVIEQTHSYSRTVFQEFELFCQPSEISEFKLYGSPDDAAWTEIHAQTSANITSSGTDFAIDSPGSYQHYGLGVNLKLIKQINNYILKNFKVDFTFLNIVSNKNMNKRLKSRKKLNRYDRFDKKFYQNVQKGFLKISNKNLVEDSSKNLIIMGRNIELTLEKDGVVIASFKVPYGSKLYAKPDDQIKKGQKICDWDPYTVPVIAETSGIANYMDLVDGVSLTVNNVKDNLITINIIPYTWKNTSLKKAKVGDRFNTEIDMLARYVFKAIKNLK